MSGIQDIPHIIPEKWNADLIYEFTPVNILFCALGGIPGALIVIILQLTGTPIT